MRLGIGVLALLVAAVVPAMLFAGVTTTLRGLGWLVLVVVAAVVLIDVSDRLTEWVERRRWGRLARRHPDATPPTTRPETPRAPRRSG
jgi:hypothetical protein